MDGARPRQADDVTSGHHLLEQVGRGLAQLVAQRRVIAVVDVHDHRVPKAELLLEAGRGVEVQRALAHDLDADQAHLACRVEQPRHLEPTDTELLGDFHLGLVLQVVAPRHSRDEHQLRGSVLCHRALPSSHPHMVSGSRSTARH